MNKIYKIIWSKLKNCYVVTSEFAKLYSKFSKSVVISRSVGIGILSCILSTAVIPPAFSAALSLGGGKANGVNTIAIGQYTIANPGGSSTNNNAFAIGMGYAENHSIIMDTYTYGTSSNGWVGAAYDYSVAIGYGNTAGIKRNSSNNFVHTDGYDLALGGQNYAIGGHSTAIGFQSTANGGHSTVIGFQSKASGEYATALGLQATASGSSSFAVDGTASGSYSIAVGRNSNASASSAIALGYGSVADVADTISVGSSSKKRKIVNVANGTATNDAATYGQVSGAIKGLSVSGKTITYTKIDGSTGTITTQDNNTTYSAATSSALGLVKTGSNITNSSGTISLTKDNVTAALGYTPPTQDTNTTYAAMGADELTTGTATTARSVTAKVLSDYVKTKTNDKITGLSVNGKVITYTKGDGTTGTITTQDTNTTYSAATNSALGLVKTGANITNSSGTISLTKDNVVAALGYTPPTTDTNTTYSAATSSNLGLVKTGANITNNSGTISLTKANVTAALGYTPPTSDTNTTYTNMTAATASAAGTAGLVPAPAAGKQNAFLRGDGTWVVPTDTNTTYGAATGSALGLVKTGANITNSSGTISLTKDNVVAALGYTPPTADTNTTYSAMSASEATTGTGTTARSITAKVLADYVNGKVTDAKNGIITGLSISGKTITYTKGDGSTGTLTTQDNNTTYDNMSASELSIGTATTARSISAKVVSDYVKTKTDDKITGLSVNGKVITYTKGDGTTGTITTQDTNTTYSAATGSALGLVKTGANITNSSGTISLTKDNVTAALGYTPPAQDTNTTYTAMSASEATTGTATTARSITAKVLGDYVKGKTNDKISSLSINGNVITYTKGDGTTGTITTPNTTYSAGSGLTLSGTTLSVNTNGTATSGNTGVVSGGTLYNAIKDKVKYDSNDKSKISFGGTRGTVLSNLLGTTITADSTDAVTGSQLYAVQQTIGGFAEDINKHSESIRSMNTSVTSALSSVAASSLLVDTMDANKADVSLNNLSESGKNVLRSFARTAVQEYMAKQEDASPVAPMVMGGSFNTGNTLSVTNAGNGSLHVGEGSYVNGASSIAIGVGNQVNANNSGAFGDPSIINADASYVLGNDDTVNTGATGSFIVGNNGVSDAKGGLLFGSNTRATTNAENGMALGNHAEVLVNSAIALGVNSVADVENTLSIGNGNLKRKIVNVADGDVSQNSNEVVTGAQLFVTNEKVRQNTEAIEHKADIDAGNINTSDWATKLGIGLIKEGNTDLVNGGTVYNAIRDSKENGLVQSDGTTITIGANNSASVIDISSSDGGTRVLRGVAVDVDDVSSAANVGYVNAVGDNIVKATNNAFQKMNTKVNQVGASAAALASLPTPVFDGDEKWAFSAGVGYYRGETAASAGAFYRPQDNVIVRVGGSFGNGDEMVGAGVSVFLNKADTPAVSKAQLVRTINAQANEIQQVKQENIAMRTDYETKIAAQNHEIAELKAMVADLATKVK